MNMLSDHTGKKSPKRVWGNRFCLVALVMSIVDLWTNPDQRTDTIHVWETYLDEIVWLARLADYGIIPEIDEQGNLLL